MEYLSKAYYNITKALLYTGLVTEQKCSYKLYYIIFHKILSVTEYSNLSENEKNVQGHIELTY